MQVRKAKQQKTTEHVDKTRKAEESEEREALLDEIDEVLEEIDECLQTQGTKMCPCGIPCTECFFYHDDGTPVFPHMED